MALRCARARRSRAIGWSVSFFLGLFVGRVVADGEPTVILPATVVRALRIETPQTSTSTTVETLDAAGIAARNPSSLAEALEGLAGLRIQRYGGFGSLQSLSLHGATGEHVVVVRDGVRLNSPQHGLTDLSLYDAHELGRVEVASGGYSALYGADAMGGVVYLESQAVSELPSLSLRATAGSFGWRGADVGARMGNLYAAFGRILVTNDYPYDWYGQPRTRWNSDAQQNTARLRFEMNRWTLSAYGTRRHAGVPGPDTGAVPSSNTPRTRQEDEDGYMTLRGVIPLSTWRLETTLNVRGSYQRYHDPLIHIDSRHRVRSASVAFQVGREFERFRLVLGGDGERASIRSTETTYGNRQRGSLFVLGVFSATLGPKQEGSLDLALREDVFSEFGSAWSPRLGGLIRWGNFRFFANVSENFRAPSFNSLYWRPGGNPNLQPEHGIHRNVGAGWFNNPIEFEVSYLKSHYRNQIRWFPTPSGPWAARNISRSTGESWGVWISYRSGAWRVRLDGSHTLALQKDGTPLTNPAYGKQMPFMPKNMASAEVTYEQERIGFSVRHRWVGKTYTRADNRDFLPAYAVTDGGMWIRLRGGKTKGEIRLDVDNLWNRRYFVRPQYPLPGRTFRFGITTHL